MNFTVIPFFLAASVVVNDPSKWTFGPEYTFKVNISSETYTGSMIEQQIYTVKCRPTMNRLICHLHNFFHNLRDFNTTYKDTTDRFAIDFSPHGLIALWNFFTESEEPNWNKHFMRDLIKILNFYTLSEKLYLGKNWIMMGNSEYMIRREEAEIDMLEERDTDFRFMVLPSTEVKPGTTLWNEMSQMGYINTPYQDLLGVFHETAKIENFSSKIQISNRFKIFIKYNCYACLCPNKTVDAFKEIIQISLNSIEPAQNRLSIFD